MGGAECGDLVYDGVGQMTKGRTDGMVVSASFSTGCKSVSYKNLVGTGFTEAYDYSGQRSNCVRYGQEDVARMFRYYFDTEIDPSAVRVTCSKYQGPD
jgi:hypothetical protein